jgi:hypothetical protein
MWPADDLLRAIEIELNRIGAGPSTVGERDSIWFSDEAEGWASLGASEQRADFYWYGRAQEIVARLRRVHTDAGPDAVRFEFRVDFPPALEAALRAARRDAVVSGPGAVPQGLSRRSR